MLNALLRFAYEANQNVKMKNKLYIIILTKFKHSKLYLLHSYTMADDGELFAVNESNVSILIPPGSYTEFEVNTVLEITRSLRQNHTA